MSYNKVYENKPIWHNDREPSINETRLNALSNATDIIDNRVIELDEKPLEDISNMQITDLQNGQGIKWNAELGKWENGIVGGNPRMTWANYQQAWERGEIEPLTVVTITDLSDSYINVVALTWQQYQALIEQELDDDNIFYVITDRSASLDLISTEISPTKAWSSEYTNDKFSAINSKLEWKSLGWTTQSSGALTLPQDFSELYIRIKMSEISDGRRLFMTIPKIALTNADSSFRCCTYVNANTFLNVGLWVSLTELKFHNNVCYNNGNLTTDFVADVFYR